jgi:hypothetical protein
MSLPATGDAAGIDESVASLLGAKTVRLNFDSPEWPAKRDELAAKLNRLTKAIADEQRLNELREIYANYRDGDHLVDVVLCTGSNVDAFGESRLINPIQLPREQACALADMQLADLIGQRRKEIEQLLSEITVGWG